MQFWMQFAEQWQKAWAEAMGFGVRASKPHDSVGQRLGRFEVSLPTLLCTSASTTRAR
jgi:hypothetical protein